MIDYMVRHVHKPTAALNLLRNKFLYQTQHCAEAVAVDKAFCESTSSGARRSTMDREGSFCFSGNLIHLPTSSNVGIQLFLAFP